MCTGWQANEPGCRRVVPAMDSNFLVGEAATRPPGPNREVPWPYGPRQYTAERNRVNLEQRGRPQPGAARPPSSMAAPGSSMVRGSPVPGRSLAVEQRIPQQGLPRAVRAQRSPTSRLDAPVVQVGFPGPDAGVLPPEPGRVQAAVPDHVPGLEQMSARPDRRQGGQAEPQPVGRVGGGPGRRLQEHDAGVGSQPPGELDRPRARWPPTATTTLVRAAATSGARASASCATTSSSVPPGSVDGGGGSLAPCPGRSGASTSGVPGRCRRPGRRAPPPSCRAGGAGSRQARQRLIVQAARRSPEHADLPPGRAEVSALAEPRSGRRNADAGRPAGRRAGGARRRRDGSSGA